MATQTDSDRSSAASSAPDYDVIVIGGGFGGLEAAKTAAHHGLRVALVDSHGHLTFQPLLYQVATGILPVEVIDYPLRDNQHFTTIGQEVLSLDPKALAVTLGSGESLRAHALVLATGASVNFFNTPGAEEHAIPLYTDHDALALKARLEELVAADQPVRVSVIGAGATGMEITGAICDLFAAMSNEYQQATLEIDVIDRAAMPLGAMTTASQAYAAKVMSESQVNLHCGRSVCAITADSVTLDDGNTLAADVVIWAAGVRARLPQVSNILAAAPNGRVFVDETLRLPDHPRVFAIGDCAVSKTSPLPQLGAVAKQQGAYVGHAVHKILNGHYLKKFAYHDLGVMAMLRVDRAVVEAPGSHVHLEGQPAFAMWLGIHAVLLPDDHARRKAITDWAHELNQQRPEFLKTE